MRNSCLCCQAGPQADATAEVRAHQETQEQVATGLRYVAGSRAAGRESTDHPVAAGQSQPIEAERSTSSDLHVVRQLQLDRVCRHPAERRLGLGHGLRLRFRVARIRPAVIGVTPCLASVARVLIRHVQNEGMREERKRKTFFSVGIFGDDRLRRSCHAC